MDKRGLRKQILTQLIKKDPASLVEELLRLEDLYHERLWLSKGDKGDKGEQGIQGLRGISIQGEKGDKGDKGEPGKDGKDGKDGRNGINGRDGKNGTDAQIDLNPLYQKVEQLKNYLDTKFSSKLITVEQVIDALRNLKGEQRLDARNIKNLPLTQPQAKNKKIDFSDMRWHGGGLSTSTIYTQSGTISSLTSLTVLNPLNVVFQFIINGEGWHFNSDYTVSSNVATYTPALDSAYLGKNYTIVYA